MVKRFKARNLLHARLIHAAHDSDEWAEGSDGCHYSWQNRADASGEATTQKTASLNAPTFRMWNGPAPASSHAM